MRVSERRPLTEQAAERLEAGAPLDAIALALIGIARSLEWFLDAQDASVEMIEEEVDAMHEIGGEG